VNGFAVRAMAGLFSEYTAHAKCYHEIPSYGASADGQERWAIRDSLEGQKAVAFVGGRWKVPVLSCLGGYNRIIHFAVLSI
jgi:hypothetical protein